MATEKYRSFYSIRELDIDIGLCQSGDHPAIGVPDFVLHISTHHERIDSTLDSLCLFFFFGEAFTMSFHIASILGSYFSSEFSVEKCLHDTMYEKIWVATDRRSEVTIVGKCETEVPLRSIAIDRLRHLWKKETREAISFARISELLEVVADMSRFEVGSK